MSGNRTEYFAAVRPSDGFIDHDTVAYTRQEARRKAGKSVDPAQPNMGWQILYKKGWRIDPVRLTYPGTAVYRGK